MTAADGYSLSASDTLVLTFQALVSNPLAAGINQVTNTATARTTQQPTPRLERHRPSAPALGAGGA